MTDPLNTRMSSFSIEKHIGKFPHDRKQKKWKKLNIDDDNLARRKIWAFIE